VSEKKKSHSLALAAFLTHSHSHLQLYHAIVCYIGLHHITSANTTSRVVSSQMQRTTFWRHSHHNGWL